MICLLTLNWDGLDKLKKLYPSVIKAMEGLDWAWYIRDHNSKDGSVDYLKSIANDNIKPIYYYTNKENFAQGMNYLFDQANPKDDDLILFLNNDIVIHDPSSIKNMISCLKGDVGIVGAKILYPESNKIAHAGVIFSNKYGGMPWHYKAGEQVTPAENKNRYFQAVTAAVMLTRGDIFRQAGMLDTKYMWSFEDIDFNLTVKYKLNKQIVYCGDTVIYHEESATLKKNPVNKLFMNQNVNYFKSKWFGKYEIDHDKYLNDINYNVVK